MFGLSRLSAACGTRKASGSHSHSSARPRRRPSGCRDLIPSATADLRQSVFLQILRTTFMQHSTQPAKESRLHGVQYCSEYFLGLQSTLIKVIDRVGAVERLRKSHHVHVRAKMSTSAALFELFQSDLTFSPVSLFGLFFFSSPSKILDPFGLSLHFRLAFSQDR